MAGQLTHGTRAAPKGATTVLATIAARFWNAIAFAQVLTQTKGYHEQKEKDSNVGSGTDGSHGLDKGGIVFFAVVVFLVRIDHSAKDHVEHKHDSGQDKHDSIRGSTTTIACRQIVQFHAGQDLPQSTGVTPKSQTALGMTTTQCAAIAQAITPTTGWNRMRALIAPVVLHHNGVKPLSGRDSALWLQIEVNRHETKEQPMSRGNNGSELDQSLHFTPHFSSFVRTYVPLVPDNSHLEVHRLGIGIHPSIGSVQSLERRLAPVVHWRLAFA